MSDASIDGNSRQTLTGVDSSDGKTPVKIYANATTHRLLVDTAANPGGSSTQVQFNDGGDFGGFGAWDKTNSILTIPGVGPSGSGIQFTPVTAFHVFSVHPKDQTNANTDGNDMEIFGGTAKGNATGGTFTMYGGDGDSLSDSNGGVGSMAGGQGFGSGDGGQLSISGGDAHGTGAGGEVQILGGTATSGTAGKIHLETSIAANGGGRIEIWAGNASAGDTDGSDIELATGAGHGAGVAGKFKFWGNGFATVAGILNFDSLDTSDKTFTFPNASGTIALKTAASGSFLSADAKTVTVVNGIITSIA